VYFMMNVEPEVRSDMRLRFHKNGSQGLYHRYDINKNSKLPRRMVVFHGKLVVL